MRPGTSNGDNPSDFDDKQQRSILVTDFSHSSLGLSLKALQWNVLPFLSDEKFLKLF